MVLGFLIRGLEASCSFSCSMFFADALPVGLAYRSRMYRNPPRSLVRGLTFP